MYQIHIPGLSDPLSVGKIVCIGRNYAKHAAEMKSELPQEPMIFLKPSTALVPSGSNVELPGRSGDVHHEVELVVIIGTRARRVGAGDALAHVAGYAVGLDMTARDLQAKAKRSGTPWTIAKGFDTFAPIGAAVPASEVPDPQNLELSLRINGLLRQGGSTRDMIFPVSVLISYCSSIFTLEPGDLIYTGTPEGVGPVAEGDRIEASISGFPLLKVSIVR